MSTSKFFTPHKGRPAGSINKSKTSPKDRILQFRNVKENGLEIRNNELFCGYCGYSLNHERKSTIKNHIESSNHRKRKGELANTPSISQVVENLEEKTGVWEDMAKSFVAAGVPLHVFENAKVRNWISKYVKYGETLPGVTTLRKNLVKLGEADLETSKKMLREKDVCVFVDETMDIKNRKVVNVLIGSVEPETKPRIVLTKFVEKCDGITIANVVLDALRQMEIQTDRLICLKTDNAKYMYTAAETLKGICPRIIHSTCWSHILHLLAEQVRNKLGTVDAFIANFKASLVKAGSRRNELLDSMERNKRTRVLPPFPVITRWCTWLEFGDYIYDRFEAIAEYVDFTEENSVAVKKLKDLTQNNLNVLKQELALVHSLRTAICPTLRKMEGNGLNANEVWILLCTVEELCKCIDLGVSKLKLYMDSKHPAREFWKQVQFLDPRKLRGFSTSELPSALGKMSKHPIPAEEIASYVVISRDLADAEEFDIIKFWKSYRKELPLLSELAITALSFPSSTSDVERSFSCLRRILTPLRNKLSEENLGIHLRLAFNQMNNTNEDDTAMASWDDDV